MTIFNNLFYFFNVLTFTVAERTLYYNITYIRSKDHGEMAESLSKMCLTSELDSKDTDFMNVNIPPSRPDVMHMADILEDVAIAHGFDNITKTQPKTNTSGKQVCL